MIDLEIYLQRPFRRIGMSMRLTVTARDNHTDITTLTTRN